MTHTPARSEFLLATSFRTLAACLFVLSLCLLAVPFVQAQDNRGFEMQPNNPNEIPGWYTPPQVSQQGITTRSIFPRGVAPMGDGVGEIIRPETAQIFGQILQGIDPRDYRGKRVELSAFVRVEQLGAGDVGAADPDADAPVFNPDLGDPTHARAQLWMRVDRERRARGFFDNMQDRPVLDNGRWNDIRIIADIHPDATAIYLGLMTFGHSRVLVDEISLSVIGDAEGFDVERPLTLSTPIGQRAAPLSDRGARSLQALGNAVGYARWFSPAEGAISTNWDRVLVGQISRFERVDDDRALIDALQDMLAPSVPGLTFWTGARQDGPPWAQPTFDSGTHERPGVHRTHHGLYRNERVVLDDSEQPRGNALSQMPEQAWLPVGTPVERELVPGVWMRWTIRLPVDSEGNTIPTTRSQIATLPDTELDREIRLASVLIAGTAIDHFFPYADVVSTAYEHELSERVRRALRDSASANTTLAHVRSLRRLLAITNDGHGGVYHSDTTPGFVPPFSVRRVGDDLVVARINGADAPKGIAPGDRIVSIDNIPIDVYLAEQEAEIPGSPQWKAWISAAQFGSSIQPAAFTVGVRTGDAPERAEEVDRVPAGPAPVLESRPESFAQVAPGVVYVDLTTITERNLNIGFDAMEITGRSQPRAMIFDMRGYPGAINPSFLSRFIRVPVRSPDWMVPLIRLPDRDHLEWSQSRWLLEPLSKRLDCEVVFLTDARAISYAESILGVVKGEHLGTIVGSATAGANGNVVTVNLPGDISMAFTGMRVVNQNGTMHHVTGVLPHVVVHPTVEGLAAGTDEVLEHATQMLQQQIGG